MNLRTLYYKFVVETIGPYSTGMTLQKRFGLESGPVLSYIYSNKVNGENFLGKWLDKKFLASPLWHSLRKRKLNVQDAINSALKEFYDKKAYPSVKVCDFACGNSDYIVDLLKNYHNDRLELDFRDKDGKSQRHLRTALKPYKNVTANYRTIDIFEDRAYEFYDTPVPDIVVLSGFFDNVCDDEVKIDFIFDHIKNCLNPDGYFIFTVRNKKIQIKTIDEIFEPVVKVVSKDEKEQNIIKDKVITNGFKIISETTDDENHYVVYTAVKMF